ncbi:patatin-like phospholipase family protein [Roseateles sp. SL47]|uniref:patatin-like phospholipase family protein n=1 Tax=Roseateles sp. SL47 TaxID=2995138 RepID=UPI002271DA8D|nr:patatin-like phospholipase family protein [Roseateles sp. SL47]WAC75124.1 patatin-like phospholipase family protein [Roseateles sp. SL47]
MSSVSVESGQRRRWLRGLAALCVSGLSACSVMTPAPTPTPAPVAPPPVEAELPAPITPKPPPKPPRIGLALGGGAARGFAHVGVIQVLEEQGIKVDLVAGTSAGSLVGALYASGRNGKELATLAETMDEGAITDWTFPMRGLIRGEALARFIREKTGNRNIEQLPIPLGIVATDLGDGTAIMFRQGDVGTAVRASSAVPAVFQPVKIGTREYVDGGLVAPVPVRFARQMGADLVIAVDISEAPDPKVPGDAVRMLLQTFSIMGRSISQYELKEADVVLRPRLEGVSGSDFTVRRRAIQVGRDAATAMLPQIRRAIAAKTR